MPDLDKKGHNVVSAIEACCYGDINRLYGSSNRIEITKALQAFKEYVLEVQALLNAAIAAKTKEDSSASQR